MPPQINYASPLPDKTGNTKIAFFSCCISALLEFNQSLLDFVNLFDSWLILTLLHDSINLVTNAFRRGGKSKHRLLSYLVNNTSAKNYHSRIVFVKIIQVKGGAFFETVYMSTPDVTGWQIAYFMVTVRVRVRVRVDMPTVDMNWKTACAGYRSVKWSRAACRRGQSSVVTRAATVTWRPFQQLNDAAPTPHAAHGTPDSGPWFVHSSTWLHLCVT